MASLGEATGAFFTWAFVPSNVIEAQAQTQRDLVERQDRLNSNIPETLATAKQSGILSDGQAKQSLQDMNRAIYLVSDSDRVVGEKILGDIVDSIGNAPSVAIGYANDQVLKPTAGAVGGAVKTILPWQIWLVAGIVLTVGIAVFAYVKGKA